MRVGLIGTGAISHKHAMAYRNIGYQITVCTNRTPDSGRRFAETWGAEFVPTLDEVCNHPKVDFVDLCTFPDCRLQVVRMCAASGKHVLVQKPMATDVATAQEMIDVARRAGIQLGVVSQRRFDDATLFLHRAIASGRLGQILQADAYVKWWRSAEYYSRPIKGSWETEGGGALINQAIHQADLLLHLVGSVQQVFGYWQLGSTHKIESEDNLCAVMRYANGATGVIQASTCLWPGYSERLELHSSKGSAILSGDKLTTWDIQDDPLASSDPPPLEEKGASGASDPMAISVLPFERQLKEFGEACASGRQPAISGEDGLRALELVTAIYRSCRLGSPVEVPPRT